MKVSTKADHRGVVRLLIRHVADRENPDVWMLETLVKLFAGLHNRRVSNRARVTSVPLTPELRRQIREIRRRDRRLPQHDIAKMVGVNVGRVNETLIGVRK